MTLRTGKQIITRHTLLNNLGSRDKQNIKFGQLTKYKMKNNLLEKSYIKCSGEASPRLFYKKSKLRISCTSRGLRKYIKATLLTTCFHLM